MIDEADTWSSSKVNQAIKDESGGMLGEGEMWRTALRSIKRQVSEPGFRTWLTSAQLRKLSFEKGGDAVAVLAVPSTFAAEWLQKHYEKIIALALENSAGRRTRIHFVVEPPREQRRVHALDGLRQITTPSSLREVSANEPRNSCTASVPVSSSVNFAARQLPAQGAAARISARISASHVEHSISPLTYKKGDRASTGLLMMDAERTFSSTIVGRGNQCAVSLARRISQGEVRAGNPLYIYGPHGTGKSHLLHVIAHESCTQGRSWVEFVPATLFEGAESSQRISRAYESSHLDLLLVDDLQDIADVTGRDAQLRLAELLEKLLIAGTDIAIASTRPPGAMLALRKELQSCFDRATIVAVSLPDLELKSMFVSAQAERAGVSLHRHALQLMAVCGSNFSDLAQLCEGVFAQHRSKISLAFREQHPVITAPDVQSCLDRTEYSPSSNSGVETERIIDQVACYFDLEVIEICSASREERVLFARQVAMYLTRELTDKSYKWIANRFARQDHTTAMHSCARIEQLAAARQDVRQAILEVRQMIFGVHEYTQSNSREL